MTPRVEIVQRDAAAPGALGDGDRATAERTSPVPLSPYLAGPECRRVWEIRATQVVEDPPGAARITGVAPGRRPFRATIAPDDVASRDLVLAHGLVEVGEQEDDEDRLEIVYELPVDSPPDGRA